MAYIHRSLVGFHGRLKSTKVLINSRWSCQISDTRLHDLGTEEIPNSDDIGYYHRLLWTAPEHLNVDFSDVSTKGSHEGDVYSFGIILQEIILGSEPYSNNDANPRDIIARVKEGGDPPYRPIVDGVTSNDHNKLAELMKVCWLEHPGSRPTFTSILDCIKKLNNGRKANLVDQMLHKMERYAAHLEKLVDERTKQLVEEQEKTDKLLARMLPRGVIDKLKVGHTVKPESFEEVTIGFCDIVGFTALASESTPLQVVAVLNELYYCFDTVIENYDVYKVETIGDAYMVVSGLPVKKDKTHAGDVATMALDLLCAVTDFKISHRPREQLQLRIGMHSGPVAAGVVGQTMPRYCLFGDTVNYASRMESTGLALHIHVSPECKNILDLLGGYKLELRGDVPMKGKGVITTYFLTGKEGFNKEMPNLQHAPQLYYEEFEC